MKINRTCCAAMLVCITTLSSFLWHLDLKKDGFKKRSSYHERQIMLHSPLHHSLISCINGSIPTPMLHIMLYYDVMLISLDPCRLHTLQACMEHVYLRCSSYFGMGAWYVLTAQIPLPWPTLPTHVVIRRWSVHCVREYSYLSRNA